MQQASVLALHSQHCKGGRQKERQAGEARTMKQVTAYSGAESFRISTALQRVGPPLTDWQQLRPQVGQRVGDGLGEVIQDCRRTEGKWPRGRRTER